MNNSSFNNTNASNSDDLSCNFEDSDWTRTFKMFAVFFVGGCGIFGNIFIIVLAVKYTVRKNLHHLIINMAVADSLVVLAVCFTGVPQILGNAIWADIKMISGDTLCKIFMSFVYISLNVSLSSLVIICIERFRASRQTVLISKPYTLKQRLLVVACSWLISVAFTVPTLTYRNVNQPLPGVYVCQGASKVPFHLRIISLFMVCALICFVVTLSTITIGRISKRQEIESSLPEVQRKAREKRIASAMKMVLSSLLLYLFSYLPFGIWNIFKIILHNNYESLICLEVFVIDFLTINFLPLVNSCFSPVIYLIFLADFREAARKVLRRNEHIADCNSVQQEPSLDETKNIHSRKTQIDSKNETTTL